MNRSPKFARRASLAFAMCVSAYGFSLPLQNVAAATAEPKQKILDRRGTEQTPLIIKQIPTETDKRGTEQAPLVIKQVSVPLSADEVEGEAAAQSEHAHNERLTTDASIALAAVTAILAYFTFRLWEANKTLVGTG